MIRNYPPSLNIGRASGILLGILAGFLPFGVWCYQQGPLERFYMREYVRTSTTTILPNLGRAAEQPKPHVVIVLDPTALKCPEDARLVTLDTELGPQEKAGACWTSWPDRSFQAWLRRSIYGGHSVLGLVRAPLIFWACLAVSLVLAGSAYDVRRRRQLVLQGDRVRGPELKTVGQYNRRMVFGRDGIRIVLANGKKKVDF